MWQTIKSINKSVVATPDWIKVPELGVSKKVYEEDNITFTYHANILYGGGSPILHNALYDEFKIPSPGFDIRLSPEDRIFTFWFCGLLSNITTKDAVELVKALKTKLLLGDWILSKNSREIPPKIDIGEYEFWFMVSSGGDYVVKCDYNSFISKEFELKDFSYKRPCLPIGLRRMEWQRPVVKVKTDYEISCRCWRNKIGDMDVAQYHIFMYEE